jgi:capsular polysaccharide biosynthesis protein
MRTPEILRRLVRRFGLLLLLTAVGGAAGAAYGALKTPTYTAKAYVVAVPIGIGNDSIAALNFAQAYGRVATSDPVLAKAGVLLGADRSGLRRATAATSPDAPVIEITATGAGAAHTAAVANSIANALVEYGGNRKAETRVSLSLLAGAMPPAGPSSPRPPMELAVGAAAGLLIGGLAMLAGVGRTRAQSQAPAPVQFEMAETQAIQPSVARPLTSFRATATPTYVLSDGEVPRVVGRAVVVQEEEK